MDIGHTMGYNSKSKAMSEEYKLKKNFKLRNKIKSNFYK